MHNILRTLRYFFPYWPLAAVSSVVTVLSAAASVAAPWPLALVIDNVLDNRPLPEALAGPLGELADDRMALLGLAVASGLLLTLLINLLHVATKFVNTKLERSIVLAFRADLLSHVQRLSVPYADQVSTGRLMYGINFEASAAGSVILAIQPLAQSALTLLGMIVVAVKIDAVLAALSLTIVPVLYYAVGYYARRIQPWLLRVKGMEADSLSIVHEALQMLRVITAFGREDHETRRFIEQGNRTVNERLRLTVRETLFSLVVNMSTAVGTALVLAFGASRVLQGEVTLGQLTLMLAYVAAVYKPLEAISYTIGSLQDQFVGLQMAFHVLDTEPIIKDAPDAIELQQTSAHLRFEGVHFSYPSRSNTLSDVSFEALPGQVIAIVGPTGAGKTTLMNLIPRYYDPSQGRILLDGTDIRDLTLRSLRENISLVPQESVLFSGTIADNIRYGQLDAPMEAIIAAARQANAHDFIMRLPNQYETTVGERGVQLSGGERQRISVARAFLKDAPILLLDEPTASIDSKTEAVILDALDRLIAGRTTFLIAHRLSTIRHADRILVVNEGRIVEQGSHDELYRRDGLYRQLCDLQTGQTRLQRLQSAMFGGFDEAPDLPDWQAATVATAPLAARYRSSPPVCWLPGESCTYEVTVQNTGTDVWNASAVNIVRLSIHFGNDSDFPTDGWATDERFLLPHDVAPGGTATLRVTVTAPDSPSVYVLRHRLVKEGVAWFEQMQKSPVTVHRTVDHGHGRAVALRRDLQPAGYEPSDQRA